MDTCCSQNRKRTENINNILFSIAVDLELSTVGFRNSINSTKQNKLLDRQKEFKKENKNKKQRKNDFNHFLRKTNDG